MVLKLPCLPRPHLELEARVNPPRNGHAQHMLPAAAQGKEGMWRKEWAQRADVNRGRAQGALCHGTWLSVSSQAPSSTLHTHAPPLSSLPATCAATPAAACLMCPSKWECRCTHCSSPLISPHRRHLVAQLALKRSSLPCCHPLCEVSQNMHWTLLPHLCRRCAALRCSC